MIEWLKKDVEIKDESTSDIRLVMRDGVRILQQRRIEFVTRGGYKYLTEKGGYWVDVPTVEVEDD